MPHTARVKLITILCGNEIEDRLAADLKALGISGYTSTRANGRGLHGPRTFGVVDGANIRVEILIAGSRAPRLIELLATKYSDVPLTAYAQEVEAFPPEHFDSPS